MTDTVKHTPGPWSVTDNSWEVSSVYAEDGALIAQILLSPDVTEDTQDACETAMRANAHLIAAAPDLLEALHACEKQAGEARLILINHLNEPERTAFWKAVNIREFCRGAIAKAEGRS